MLLGTSPPPSVRLIAPSSGDCVAVLTPEVVSTEMCGKGTLTPSKWGAEEVSMAVSNSDLLPVPPCTDPEREEEADVPVAFRKVSFFAVPDFTLDLGIGGRGGGSSAQTDSALNTP